MMENPFNRNAIMYTPVLDTDKVENLEDCKKILSFLCKRVLTPITEGVTYTGFDEVERYFRNPKQKEG